MTKDLADKLQRLTDRLFDCLSDVEGEPVEGVVLKDDATDILEWARQLAAWNARANSPEGEPVAWRRRGKNLRWEYRDDGSSSVAVSEWAPLYTRPVAWPDRAALAREAAAEITRLRERDQDVREELADAWPEDREAVLAGDPVSLIAKLIQERDEWISDYAATRAMAADALSAQTAEIERMREALIRLRDCNWVITPLDRMDAVRDIARQALTDKDG